MSTSHSYTPGVSWQDSVSHSDAVSQTDGTTVSRGYEYLVEPTEIQRLGPTAFILVNANQEARRWVAADCNPAIAGHDRVSPVPYREEVPSQE